MARDDERSLKVKDMSGSGRVSALRRYRALYYGDMSAGRALLCELLTFFLSGLGGALGLFLRSKLYPLMFASVGRGVVFGRHMVIRHAHRIRIGAGTILDDHCVIDAKGTENRGIQLGARVYVGRNTILYTKNGNITIGDDVNISSNCQVFSSNEVVIGSSTVIGAYSYLLSGGGYDPSRSAPRFAEQDGFLTKGPLSIGENCWLGAGVIVLDAASLGAHCVAAAGAVVTHSVPPDTLVAGVPAKPLKSLAAS